ncbi:DMT family transporter [Ureibacillus acetophenoni]|uniref:Drug/metabolite transporter (DMT)-like permease n=1 Tax=Ureibacillus acetophenoni TaxID=614649 RepID=A0A285U357_9BACL|nr:DMT family transporter [Ureibacillus acetophenoni]SOC36272.1 drug/metabolite transporter (DMT)-like permease [Ureibacillus acetophenoni]
MSNAKIYTILVLVMLAWGLNVTWLKIIVSNGDPLTLQSVRIFLAGITVFTILLILRQKLYVRNMPWKYILLGSFFGVICHHAFLAFGIQQTTGTKTAIISGLSPLIVALIAVIFKDTIMTKSKLIGFILGGIGVLTAVLRDFRELLSWELGDILVFLSFFLQAFSFIAIRRGTKTISPLLMTAYMLTIGSILLVLSSSLINPSSFVSFATTDLTFWSVFLLSAIVATGLGHSLYNLCIKHIGTAESAIFVNLNTVFALFGTTILLHELITYQQITGTIIIITGVLIGTSNIESIITKYKNRQKKSQEEENLLDTDFIKDEQKVQ